MKKNSKSVASKTQGFGALSHLMLALKSSICHSPFATRYSLFANDRGVALVIVLWILVFLLVAAFDFSASVREEGMIAHRYVEETEAYYLALAGFEERLYRLLAGGSGASAEGEVEFGEWHEAALGDGSFRVRVVDEGGKVNLNQAEEVLLRRIFANLGVEEPQRSTLVDSILDWRDQDNLHRLNGAENDYYLSLALPYTAKNGPFDTVEDLLWVRGMTPELFYGREEGGTRRGGLREIFTVDSRLNQINLRTASAEVCRAVMGLPLEGCHRFVEERKKLSGNTLVDLLGLLGLSTQDIRTYGLVFVPPSVVTIESLGYRSGSAIPRRVRGVLRLLEGGRGAELIRWLDRDAGPSPGSAG